MRGFTELGEKLFKVGEQSSVTLASNVKVSDQLLRSLRNLTERVNSLETALSQRVTARKPRYQPGGSSEPTLEDSGWEEKKDSLPIKWVFGYRKSRDYKEGIAWNQRPVLRQEGKTYYVRQLDEDGSLSTAGERLQFVGKFYLGKYDGCYAAVDEEDWSFKDGDQWAIKPRYHDPAPIKPIPSGCLALPLRRPN